VFRSFKPNENSYAIKVLLMMRTKYIVSIFVLLFVFLLIADYCFASKRIALVIGNEAYKHGPLYNPVNDALAMAKVLQACNFEVMLRINADQGTMKAAIREFGKRLKEDSTGLFYYAGHGMQVDGVNYLIPIGAHIESEADVKDGTVNAGFILDKMEDASNGLNIVILDACRNNPFRTFSRSITPGLARMNAPKGSLIAYATAPEKVAYDGKKGGNGVYTKHLVDNIQKPGLKIEEVLKNVRIAVLAETDEKQIPWESSSLIGDFYFIPAMVSGPANITPAPVAQPTAIPDKQLSDIDVLIAQVEAEKLKKQKAVGKLYAFGKSCKDILSGTKLMPEERAIFAKCASDIISDKTIWMPLTENDKRIAERNKTVIKTWIQSIEAYYSSLVGNKRDLIELLNICITLDIGLGLPPINTRYPDAVSYYSNYAEKYRREPEWGIPLDIWIDADTGFSLLIEDRVSGAKFIYIPEGYSFFGDPLGDIKIQLSGFYIQKTEVSNKEFLKFCQETSWQYPEHLIRRDSYSTHDDQPVVNVSFIDASNYCKWLNSKYKKSSSKEQWKCLLPSEAQWEKACRLGFPFLYPQGELSHNFNTLFIRKQGEPEKVMRLSHDIAVSGVMGLGGNVSEWCIDGWTDKPENLVSKRDIDPILSNKKDTRKVIKGTTYFSNSPKEFQIYYRQAREPGNFDKALGLRPVVFTKNKNYKKLISE
jgi:formylglycine-generating enzyme required for sulfatase activity